MKNQGHKGVREMPVRRTARDKGTTATITVDTYDNGMWSVNGDPCQDDLTAARLVMQCLESLADARDRREPAA
jgi:hypothetical protein